ncbi:MAG: hypothetical protein KGY69_19600 [Bacteroidales bacterium]|nr:hypothetical protein [Bacteroidales bacterium]
MTTITIKEILNQISKLEDDKKIQVMERILKMLKKEEKTQNSKPKLKNLKGLGADIWRDIDIDKYVERERQWD